MQVTPIREKPALHRQSDGRELPSGDDDNEGQRAQVEAPALSEYVPA